MKNEFEIRSYGKSELAMLYAPELTESGARSRLRRWLSVNPRLRYLLKGKSKTYTPRQVQKIVDELGEPEWPSRTKW